MWQSRDFFKILEDLGNCRLNIEGFGDILIIFIFSRYLWLVFFPLSCRAFFCNLRDFGGFGGLWLVIEGFAKTFFNFFFEKQQEISGLLAVFFKLKDSINNFPG